ncbi:phage tail tube protein [Paenibacillus thiaminolyticus]|uniref:Phage portal protein n=1 Tax=Paenibacillus thiaminolyticus TaxID=49283 RepID=A0AAP9DTA8_PANTH|nr:phage tail tube protein [Paenibacillus thiaminolyticus]MCY9537347.1 phage tail tube protein [Paenibacillus thiaminolyticus]MCY9601008.1 phage tail tube protein [Paenibacillus thiaminolyticus]MCY9609453.1 phage tail tube protein [Paenibacillus thiaminolyticus]MCY9613273.1 phage tail tube protein [Paenibacillus thiaminolyticus]MCY9617688.1 phage tail tube protein [Paenibacillus thiaminolyticus]
MALLQAKDTISGREGRAFAQIDGKNEEMFYVKTLEAKIEKQKAEVKVLGSRSVQHKAAGWTGTGSMTIYYMTPLFRNMMLEYVKNGKDTNFIIQITNEDPMSSIGTQTVCLKNVNLNSVVMAKLDTESDVLEEEVEFTFDDVDILNNFNSIS